MFNLSPVVAVLPRSDVLPKDNVAWVVVALGVTPPILNPVAAPSPVPGVVPVLPPRLNPPAPRPVDGVVVAPRLNPYKKYMYVYIFFIIQRY